MSFSAEWLKQLGDVRSEGERKKSITLLLKSDDELLKGYQIDAAKLIMDGLMPAGTAAGQDITIGPLPFSSLCEHHMLPFIGELEITYTPTEYILGLGRFPRVIEALSARLTLQETLTAAIADVFYVGLKAKKISVTMTAHHSCLRLNYGEAHQTALTTTARRGD